MKHEQVVPDYIVMLESSITVLALVGCGWLLFKLVSACIWFPQYMKNLEIEAEKANAHLEKTLLPKGSFEGAESDSPTEKEEGSSKVEDDVAKAVETPEQQPDNPADDEEPKKDK